MEQSAHEASLATETEKERFIPIGEDRYRSTISVVESGLTVASVNTDTDLAELYAELQEMGDEGIEDIRELQDTLDEYLGLGVIYILIWHYQLIFIYTADWKHIVFRFSNALFYTTKSLLRITPMQNQ